MIKITEKSAFLGKSMPTVVKNTKDDQGRRLRIQLSDIALRLEEIDQFVPVRKDERKVSRLFFAERDTDSEFRHFKPLQLDRQITGAELEVRLQVVDQSVEIHDATLSKVKFQPDVAGQMWLSFQAEWQPRGKEYAPLASWLDSEVFVAIQVPGYGDQLEL